MARSLTVIGHAVKTIYIFRYLQDETLRDRIQLRLNRSESRHQLARRIFFANQGAFRTGDYREIMNKVSASSLLPNAVLVFNTVRLGEILERLKHTGERVDEEALRRISPLLHAHVIRKERTTSIAQWSHRKWFHSNNFVLSVAVSYVRGCHPEKSTAKRLRKAGMDVLVCTPEKLADCIARILRV